jgi:hypothetical protein
MNNTNGNTFLDIFKKSFDTFGKNMCDGNYYVQNETLSENETSVLFYVPTFEDLFYLLYIKKQNIVSDKLPTIKNQSPLNSAKNPYHLVSNGGQIDSFTDETFLLSEIYEYLMKYSFKQIACYKNYGILVSNPLDSNGIYNINVKCFKKGELKQ